MHLRAPAILLAARQHGETAVVARLLTEQAGVVAGYIAGGRGRQLRPVIIPGNTVAAELRSRSDSQLPFAKLELIESRGPWLSEPLPAAAIGWACALTATALPERHPYPSLWEALGGLLDAICHAPSARGWARALAGYEILLLRELGYGGGARIPEGELPEILDVLGKLGDPIDQYLLADRRGDVMAARTRLLELLGRMA
ncbi:DNA recombination protein RecO [Altererythrobacter salegens]|uniref:DNA recombination protein RecO n=1 Tax=Croceibacterium salegens TaxID=1737568 RepID=A0A6I4SVE7_9SPHN|nr:recombination protein O N-terminal domain-containing protein [Croceibacterium salegens]MXO59319.1 DNA recombination protein RecO [Croceibacterium salegens]